MKIDAIFRDEVFFGLIISSFEIIWRLEITILWFQN